MELDMEDKKPPEDAIVRLRKGVFIATERMKNVAVTGDERLQGDLVPEASFWPRAFVDLTNARRLVRLSPEACVAVVREALNHDPALLADIVHTVREGLAPPAEDAPPVPKSDRKKS